MNSKKYLYNCVSAIVMFFCFIDMSFADDGVVNQQEQSPPLVLSIPGLVIPGKNMTQAEHYGNLGILLNDMNIPYQCIVYDSHDDPLSAKSGLITEKYSIISTRVIPGILFAIEKERIRRESNKLPPLREVVIMGYSQGGLIALQFIGRNFRYKNRYDEYIKEFANEYQALINDPIYMELVEAVNVYEKMLAVEYQNEAIFKKHIDLKHVSDWLEMEAKNRFNRLRDYICDPSSIFPNAKTFDPPQTSNYPKEYNNIKKFFLKKSNDTNFIHEFHDFITEDALFRAIRDLEIRVMCFSGSLFGSPEANIGYDILEHAKIFERFVHGVQEIKDTRLGSPQHIRTIETLINFENESEYPLNNRNILFILGANNEKGDGFVEQPCAHLSGHQYAEIDLADYRCEYEDRNNPVYIKREDIPDLTLVPLEVHHFPVKTFFGLGPVLPGSAYIDSIEHPSFKYVKAFIEKDYDSIEGYKNSDKTVMRQFMVEFTLGNIERVKEKLHELHIKNETAAFNELLNSLKTNIELKNKPAGLHIQSKFFNKENLTYVFIGYVDVADIKQEHSVDFVIKLKGYPPLNVSLPVKAGEITFLRVYDTDSKITNID